MIRFKIKENAGKYYLAYRKENKMRIDEHSHRIARWLDEHAGYVNTSLATLPNVNPIIDNWSYPCIVLRDERCYELINK